MSENKKVVVVLGYIILILILGITLGFAISKSFEEQQDCSLAIPILYENPVISNDSCWLWVTDNNGNGFGTETNYCMQLKNNCETPSHNLRCNWVENNNIKGCSCKGKDDRWKCINKERRVENG